LSIKYQTILYVSLNHIELFAYHGIYTFEKEKGNTFIVSAKVGFEPDELITALDQTINYEHLLHIIQHYMQIPTPLLETIAQQIVRDVKLKYPAIKYAFLSIQKKNPPMKASIGSSEIIVEETW
jgi:Dihydroneopterin aldolase